MCHLAPYPDSRRSLRRQRAVPARADWYRAFTYTAEADRGPTPSDLASPGVFTFRSRERRRRDGAVDAGLAGDAAAPSRRSSRRGRRRRGSRRRCAPPPQLPRRALRSHRPPPHDHRRYRGSPTGRDTFILAARLCLATHRATIPRESVRNGAGVSRGMLPNRFDEQSSSRSTNSVDAALWFVIGRRGVSRRRRHTATAMPRAAIAAIVDGYQAGPATAPVRRRRPARVGEPWVQLTGWNARVGELCVTPRIGKPGRDPGPVDQRVDHRPAAAPGSPARAAFDKVLGPRPTSSTTCSTSITARARSTATCRRNPRFSVSSASRTHLSGERGPRDRRHVERVCGPGRLRTLDPPIRATPRYIGNPGDARPPATQRAVCPARRPLHRGLAPRPRQHRRRRRPPAPASSRPCCPRRARRPRPPVRIFDGDPPHRSAGCPSRLVPRRGDPDRLAARLTWPKTITRARARRRGVERGVEPRR